MTGLAESQVLSSAGSAGDRLKQFLAHASIPQQGAKRQPSDDFEPFERQ